MTARLHPASPPTQPGVSFTGDRLAMAREMRAEGRSWNAVWRILNAAMPGRLIASPESLRVRLCQLRAEEMA